MNGVLGWLFQRISGMVLFAGLVIHLYTMHYIGHEQVKHELVIKRLSDPYWVAFNFIFLISVIYHGFNGIWGIALEYISSKGLLKVSQSLILAMASLLLATGIYILSI